MASYVVDGLVLPVSVGGHPVLDFCNTRAGWGGPTPKEYLHSYPHLARWAVENGLLASLPAGRRRPARGRAVLRRAIALRDALYAVLVGPGSRTRLVGPGLVGPGGGDAWSVINREVRAAAPTLVPAPGGAMPARWWLDPTAAAAPLSAVAWAAAGFLTAPAAAAVRRLPGRGLRLGLRRPPGPAAVVFDGVVRQPGQGQPARPAATRERAGLA